MIPVPKRFLPLMLLGGLETAWLQAPSAVSALASSGRRLRSLAWRVTILATRAIKIFEI